MKLTLGGCFISVNDYLVKTIPRVRTCCDMVIPIARKADPNLWDALFGVFQVVKFPRIAMLGLSTPTSQPIRILGPDTCNYSRLPYNAGDMFRVIGNRVIRDIHYQINLCNFKHALVCLR